jgi:hypothetical protein
MTYTYFKEDYRRKGSAVPGSRLYERIKKLRAGIELYYGMTKENRIWKLILLTCERQ